LDLGDRIRELRGLYGHSQQDLAKIFDVKRPTISTWESQNALPNYKSLKKLSQIYNVSLTYLLDEEYNNTVYVVPIIENLTNEVKISTNSMPMDRRFIEKDKSYIGAYIKNEYVLCGDLKENDLVIIEKGNEVNNGDLIVVKYNNNIYIRYVVISKNQVILYDNRHEPIVFHIKNEKNEIIGKILEVRRSFKK
jgi:transcriptional regulator with XRE-family HTH domain